MFARYALAATLAFGLALTARAVHLDDIRQAVKQPGVRTVEALLATLPQELRANYVLMTSSRCQHRASPSNPRVLLFDGRVYGETEPLLLAFSGDPTDPRYLALDAAQYRRATHSWELHELVFPRDGLSEVSVSEPSPHACKSCHGTDSRPLWELFPAWPGAVGAEDSLSPVEKRYLQDFVTSGASHPRYALLARQKNLETYSGFLASPSFRGLARTIEPADRDRVLHRLKATPDYARFKFALLASFYHCPSIVDFVPAGWRLGGQAAWSALETNVQKAVERAGTEGGVLARRIGVSTRLATNLRYLLEPRNAWPESLGTSPTLPFLFDSTGVAQLQFARRWHLADPELAAIESQYGSILRHVNFPEQLTPADRAEVARFCGELQTRSLAALELPPNTYPQLRSEPPPQP